MLPTEKEAIYSQSSAALITTATDFLGEEYSSVFLSYHKLVYLWLRGLLKSVCGLNPEMKYKRNNSCRHTEKQYSFMGHFGQKHF